MNAEKQSGKRGTPTRGDKAGLLAFCVAGAAIAISMTVFSISRIIELARGTDIPVLVEFTGDEVQAPLGNGGDSITLGLDRATLTASNLPPIATVVGILGQVVQIVTIIVVIGCLLLLARSILAGTVFNRRNTALVMTAGITGLFGFAAVRFFDNMLANATVNVVTDNAIDNAVITVEPYAFILAAFVIAIIGTVFVVGDRLQRDTEGLV